MGLLVRRYLYVLSWHSVSRRWSNCWKKLLQIPADDMRLSYKGKVLHDRCSLLDSGVEARQFIHVSRCGRNAYKFDIPVFLGFKASEPFDIRVRPSDLVIEAKQQIQAITQIPASKQRLTHGGRTLANECRLCDCGVRDDSCSLQVTSVNDVTAPIPEPSIPITGSGRLGLNGILVPRRDVWWMEFVPKFFWWFSKHGLHKNKRNSGCTTLELLQLWRKNLRSFVCCYREADLDAFW